MDTFTQLSEFMDLFNEDFNTLNSALEDFSDMSAQLSKAEKRNRKRAVKEQAAILEEFLDELEDMFEEVEDSLSDLDKQMFKSFNKNRKKDFKQLEKNMKQQFKVAGNGFLGLGDTLSEIFKDLSDTLSTTLEAINAINIADLKGSITDDAQSSQEYIRDIANALGSGKDGITEITNMINNDLDDLTKLIGNNITRQDLAEIVSELVEIGIKDQESLSTLSKEIAILNKTTGVAASDISDLVFSAEGFGEGFLTDFASMLKFAETHYEVSAGDIAEFINSQEKTIMDLSQGNKDIAKELVKELSSSYAAISNASVDPDTVFDLLDNIKNASIQDLASYSNATGGQAKNIQDLMRAGNTTDALELLVRSMNEDFVKIMADVGEDTGLTKDDVKALKRLSNQDGGFGFYVDQISDGLVNAADSEYAVTQAENMALSWLDKLKNAFVNSPIGDFASSLFGDLSLPEIAVLFTGVKSVLDSLKALLGSKMLSGLVEKVGQTTVATSAKGLASSAMTASKGFLAKGVAMGTGALTTIGGGSALLGGGTVLGGVSALVGSIDGIKDIVKGIKDDNSEKTTQGVTKLGMVGTGAATGAAIGSAIPVVGTAVGAVVGAGVGGLGALFGGDGLGSWFHNKGKEISSWWSGLWSRHKVKGTFKGVEEEFSKSTNNMVKESKKVTQSLGTKTKFKWYDVTTWGLGSSVDGSHKTGLDTVPYDGYIAELHKNETVLTAQEADIWRDYKGNTKTLGTSLDNNQVKIDGSHKTGLDTVPYDGYVAELHKGESVLTAREADVWRSATKEPSQTLSSSVINAENNAKNVTSNFITNLTQAAKDASSSAFAYVSKIQNSINSSQSTVSTDGTSGGGSDIDYSNITLDGNTQAASFTDKPSFVNALGKIAQQSRHNVDILPSFVVAQSLLEGAWPLSSLAKKNNLWGIKAGSNWTGDKGQYRTAEYSNGKKYYTNAWFRHYPNLETGFSDHAKLFTTNRYKDSIGVTDPVKIVSIIKKGGYFTDSESKYANSIKSIIKANDLTRFDRWTPKNSSSTNSSKSNSSTSNLSGVKTGLVNETVLNNLTQGLTPKYQQGTPFVPEDQIAYLHKNEMVVPKEKNPLLGGVSIPLTGGTDLTEVIQVLRWGFQYLGKKFEDKPDVKVEERVFPKRSLLAEALIE